jgi:peptidoglycan/xylan/chitin deacetylase (PgdA/CDA1 family)
MRGVKQLRGLVGTALDRLRVLDLARAARRRGLPAGGGLTVLLYHRVADPAEIGELDPSMIDATPAEFDTHMSYVRQHFQPVSIEDVLDARRGGRPLPPAGVLVSFDDGYRDNFQNAAPILQRHGMKGLFFITTGHVRHRRLFWWEQISLLVRRCRLARVRLTYPRAEDLDLSTPADKERVVRRLNRIVKERYALDLDRFLSGLANACEVRWDEGEARRLADQALMTWEDVRTLRRQGMGIGSHTDSHRVLLTLPAAPLAAELEDSRAALEALLGEPVTTIAYPVGRAISHVVPVRQAVAAAGYELGFTTRPGVNRMAAGDDPFDLLRLSVDRGLAPALLRTYFTFPALAA